MKLIGLENTHKAQHTRRAIQRLVGKAIGPHLRRWKLHDNNRLVIGIAEIVALRLVVERERQQHTIPAERQWTVRALLGAGRTKLWAEMAGDDNVSNDEQAYQLIDQLMQPETGWQVETIERIEVSDRPAPPFTTSTLLQAASEEFGLLPGRTERAARQLHQAELITSPLTASVAVSAAAQDVALRVITSLYGQAYVPRMPAAGDGAEGQAIRPANIPLHPDLLETDEFAAPQLSDDAHKLYGLIWRRFIASQMAPARCEVVTAAIRPTWTGCVEPWEEPGTYPHPFVFRAHGRRMLFDGCRRAYPSTGAEYFENDGTRLAWVEKDTVLQLDQLSAGPDTPPERYSVAELLATLEALGIGRPDTYAEIVESLLGLGTLRQEKGRLLPTRPGEDVLFVCLQHYPQVFTTGYAAAVEEMLDQVAGSELGRKEVIDAVYARLLSHREDKPPAPSELPFPDLHQEMAS